MKKKNTQQSSIGRWLNDEAHHKDEPTSIAKQKAKTDTLKSQKSPNAKPKKK